MDNNPLPQQPPFQYYVPTDREEQQLINEKLEMTRVTDSEFVFTSESIQRTKGLFHDINSNKIFWMNKVLRVHSLFDPPSRYACAVLLELALYLLSSEKPRKSLQVLDLALEMYGITKEIIFATPLSPAF